jgi:hypothetical protein
MVGQGFVWVDAVRGEEGVCGAEEALAAAALERKVLVARLEAAVALAVSVGDGGFIEEVASEVVALGDAILAAADFFALFEDDAVLLAERAATVDALGGGGSTAGGQHAPGGASIRHG